MYSRGHREKRTTAQRRIHAMLKAQGMDDFSLAQLGRRWKETPPTVGNFLRDPESVLLRTAKRFCKHLGCTLDDIYENGKGKP